MRCIYVPKYYQTNQPTNFRTVLEVYQKFRKDIQSLSTIQKQSLFLNVGGALTGCVESTVKLKKKNQRFKK